MANLWGAWPILRCVGVAVCVGDSGNVGLSDALGDSPEQHRACVGKGHSWLQRAGLTVGSSAATNAQREAEAPGRKLTEELRLGKDGWCPPLR